MSKPPAHARSSKAPAATPAASTKKLDEGPETDRDVATEKMAQNDRAARNQSGMGSNPSARDVTSGKRSGNQ